MDRGRDKEAQQGGKHRASNGEQFLTERVRSVPLPPSSFDSSTIPDHMSDCPSMLFDDTWHSPSTACPCLHLGSYPGRPPPRTSSKCCFCALAARHSLGRYSGSGDPLPAFVVYKRAGRRGTEKEAVGMASFMQ